jgi:hypothetical protein
MFVGSSFVLVRGSFSLCSSCVVGVAVGALASECVLAAVSHGVVSSVRWLVVVRRSWEGLLYAGFVTAHTHTNRRRKNVTSSPWTGSSATARCTIVSRTVNRRSRWMCGDRHTYERLLLLLLCFFFDALAAAAALLVAWRVPWLGMVGWGVVSAKESNVGLSWSV